MYECVRKNIMEGIRYVATGRIIEEATTVKNKVSCGTFVAVKRFKARLHQTSHDCPHAEFKQVYV